MLSHCAVGFSAVAGALFVPGKYGAPHAMLALMVAMVVSILAMRATGTGTTSLVAVASASFLGFAAALGYVLFEPPPPRVRHLVPNIPRHQSKPSKVWTDLIPRATT
ncbi:ESX-4 secretion system protein eccD4 [Mycobacteroides abscessus subsp. abscessus]|nr:ESX-4 secretion system protein eccD4 [Mycobacteroides abscessus subsp. abscessus]